MEAKLCDTTLKLLGGRFRRGQGQMCKTGVTVGLPGDLVRQPVVHLARKRGPFRGGQQIGAGSRRRQHLQADASLIHGRQPRRSEVHESVVDIGSNGRRVRMGIAALDDDGRIDASREIRECIVFF